MRSQLRATPVNICGHIFALSKLKEKQLNAIILKEENTKRPRIDRPDQAQKLQKTCEQLETFLRGVCQPRGIYQKLRNMFSRQVMGHLAYMRAESVRIYKAERLTVHTVDNYALDGILIPAKEAFSGPELLPVEGRSAVLFCGPNAGYCEFAIDCQLQWIRFYAQRGFDVCFWNYRGYGSSEGSPTPTNVVSDSEAVLHHLRETRKYTKIIIHGESLGAAVAVKLARRSPCEMLFADRTFCSLRTMAEVSVGWTLAQLVFWVTRWKMEVAQDYLEVVCPKVLANDARDSMIHELASLRSGVTRLVVLRDCNR